jgi:hypothetical protein
LRLSSSDRHGSLYCSDLFRYCIHSSRRGSIPLRVLVLKSLLCHHRRCGFGHTCFCR